MKDCLYNPSRMYNCPIIECEIKIKSGFYFGLK